MKKEKRLLIPGPSPKIQADLREACENLKRIVCSEKGEAFIVGILGKTPRLGSGHPGRRRS
jgi:hypothetical protein